MLTRTTLAVAATALTVPALAQDTCLASRTGAQCDIFLEEYRADEVPVGTAMIWPGSEFLLEDPEPFRSRSTVERPVGEDVLYWDGETAMIVPEESGPQFKIADW